MSKHDLDQMETTGYFLPEDSQFRLKKLHQHMVFLSQLAQPRMHDEAREWAPEIRTGELAVCLELLAEQAARVLDAVSWPAERCEEDDTSHEADEAGKQQEGREEDEPHEHAGQEDEAQQGEALEAATAGEEAGQTGAGGKPLLFGMTLHQMDELDRLHTLIHANGDVVYSAEQAELSLDTVSEVGRAIFDAAIAVQEIMDQVSEQRLPWAPKLSPRVREEPAAYNAGVASTTAGRARTRVVPMALARKVSGPTQPPPMRLH